MTPSTAMKVQKPETDIAVLQVQVKNVEDKILDLKEDIREIKISSREQSDETMRLIKSISDTSEQAHSALSSRISAQEKWRWMMMGAGMVIGFLGFEPLSNLFK